jgi:hypothetical protein
MTLFWGFAGSQLAETRLNKPQLNIASIVVEAPSLPLRFWPKQKLI